MIQYEKRRILTIFNQHQQYLTNCYSKQLATTDSKQFKKKKRNRKIGSVVLK